MLQPKLQQFLDHFRIYGKKTWTIPTIDGKLLFDFYSILISFIPFNAGSRIFAPSKGNTFFVLLYTFCYFIWFFLCFMFRSKFKYARIASHCRILCSTNCYKIANLEISTFLQYYKFTISSGNMLISSSYVEISKHNADDNWKWRNFQNWWHKCQIHEYKIYNT